MAKSNLGEYLSSLYGIEPLTKEEEHKLSEQIQAGNDAALNKLVTHNLRFVVSVIKELPAWRHQSIPVEDLIGYGNMHLLLAAKRWSPVNNARFATFAKPFIIKGVARDVANTANLIRIPVNVTEEVRKMQFAERKLTQELSREPKISELAQYLGKPEKRIHQLKGFLIREPSSLDVFNTEQLAEESSDD